MIVAQKRGYFPERLLLTSLEMTFKKYLTFAERSQYIEYVLLTGMLGTTKMECYGLTNISNTNFKKNLTDFKCFNYAKIYGYITSKQTMKSTQYVHMINVAHYSTEVISVLHVCLNHFENKICYWTF